MRKGSASQTYYVCLDEDVDKLYPVDSNCTTLERLLDDVHAALKVEPASVQIKRDNGAWEDISLSECGCLDEWPTPVHLKVVPVKGLQGMHFSSDYPSSFRI